MTQNGKEESNKDAFIQAGHLSLQIALRNNDLIPKVIGNGNDSLQFASIILGKELLLESWKQLLNPLKLIYEQAVYHQSSSQLHPNHSVKKALNSHAEKTESSNANTSTCA